MKKKVFYWSPCLNPVGTIKSTINSAISLKKFDQDYDVSIINACGEWDAYIETLDKNSINLIDLNFKYFKILPKRGFLASRLSYLIIFAQTRGAIIVYIFLLLFYLSLPQIKLLKKIIIISLFISIPLGLFNFIDIKKIGKHRIDQNRMKTTIENLFNSNDIQSNSIENKNLLNNKKKYEYSVSSGRIEIWKKSINHLIKEKKIFGYGPQGDRYLLTLLAKTFLDSVWGNTSSNAIIYSSISGGVIGLISILLIYVSLFIVFFKSVFFIVILFGSLCLLFFINFFFF